MSLHTFINCPSTRTYPWSTSTRGSPPHLPVAFVEIASHFTGCNFTIVQETTKCCTGTSCWALSRSCPAPPHIWLGCQWGYSPQRHQLKIATVTCQWTTFPSLSGSTQGHAFRTPTKMMGSSCICSSCTCITDPIPPALACIFAHPNVITVQRPHYARETCQTLSKHPHILNGHVRNRSFSQPFKNQ